MEEETVTKYRCEKCGVVEEVHPKKSLLGGIKKTVKPASWGTDKEGLHIFCAKCYKQYNEGYLAWFSGFMKGK
jgi:NAD-dependent dihydropyrimidine dehydrogenase PreA subunit